MAKRGKRRGRLFVPRIKASHAVGALAGSDLGSTAFATLLDQECWAISMDVIASTPTIGATAEGPLVIGVAHSDYSAAEIEEWYEAETSWQKGDKIAQEKAKRKCRQVAILMTNQVITNDGLPIRVKLGFAIEDGKGLQLWVYNDSSTTMTTGTIAELSGKIFLSPR